jgi:hypothetical protein
MYLKLASNSQASYIKLLNAGITGVYHRTQLISAFLNPAWWPPLIESILCLLTFWAGQILAVVLFQLLEAAGNRLDLGK